MIRILRRPLCFGVLIAMLMTACAMTKITSVWKDPSYQGRPQKIMVIGVAKKPANKRIFEDEFVLQLKSRGTDAVASYTVLPEGKQDDQEAVAVKMKELTADAVLITRLTDKKTVMTYIPGTNYSPPPYYNSWHDYYGYGYQAAYAPGYLAEDEYALMETNLYDARNDKLVWSALSETEIRGSDENLIKSYIGVMVSAMADKKLFR